MRRFLVFTVVFLGLVQFCYPAPDASPFEQWTESAQELREVEENFFDVVPVLGRGE